MSKLDPAVVLKSIALPEFGEPTTEPVVPQSTYAARRALALSKLPSLGLDALVVYADREHSANMAYLTSYEPRFEEALLILVPGHKPTLVIGNEGWGYAELMAPDCDRALFQSFSLLGQPRGDSLSLSDILKNAGVKSGQNVGLAGWKYFGPGDAPLATEAFEVPHYIVETVQSVAGPSGKVSNAGNLFMNEVDGLRTLNDVDQLAVYEYAATYTSEALRNVMFGLKPGMTERDCFRLMAYNGIPLSAHAMLSSGERARHGLPSPSHKVIAEGEPFTMALGVWGALNARAGFLVRDKAGLPEGAEDYVEKLVAPYFSAIVAWYETLRIGVEGRELHRAIHSRIGDPFFGVSLNPGHYIHLDEWLHSPVTADSTVKLASGMALQVDVIPATNSPLYTTNIEDGLALADEALRAEFKAKYPEAWGRIEARRKFMIDVLGIKLSPDVLLFSNIPAYLTPYLLSPTMAMAVEG